ncbi:hypothetical protein ACJ73_06090 [Blastomyces percursus]|uniref:Uncharacterized protein n=1 Tax=Blastomyces percursus TaxID=1658174 RepID=A0A1J9Q205_9EURO|nr:hypothetical protein ACJ73_06090 [Blastomyces percursus]
MGSQSPAPLGELRNIQNNDFPEKALKQDATNEIHRSLNNAPSVSVAKYQHQSLEEDKAPLLGKPCIPSCPMNNTSRPHAANSTSMPHSPALQCVIPRDSSRASVPPVLPRQALGVVGWGTRQENVRHTTHSPLAKVGFPSFAASPTFPNASNTGFPGLASMQTSSLVGVRNSFGNTFQDHKAIPGMPGSTGVDDGRHNRSKSGGRLVSESADDVMAAATAAAVKQPQPQNLKFGDLDVDSIDLIVAVFYFGVLSIVAGLHPHFSYERTAEGNWRSFLMYWGAAFVAASMDEAYEDKFVAKTETCSSALERLKENYSG